MQAVVDFRGEGSDTPSRHELGALECLLVAEHAGAVPRVLAQAYARARAGAWVAGFVSYESAPAFDPAMAVHVPMPGLPLACFGIYGSARDLAPVRLRVAGAADGADFCVGAPWEPSVDAATAMAHMERIRGAIARGEVYQVNLTTRLRASFRGDPLAYFHALRRAQPDGYAMFLDGGAWQLLSVSPELFFDWTPAGTLTARPMKGTAPRDADPQRDAQQMRRMLASPKEQAENLMIVDLLRNDLSRVAEAGSVQVPRLFAAEALPTVWQMTSTVSCRSRAGVGLDDVFAALFPCGSVTGAPKIAAMAAIRALEGEPRGVYCGALGLIRPGGHASFSVGIRTVMVDATLGRAECGIGSGITWDSSALGEWDEWQLKQRFLARATRA
jgi:para-aminobenzoate synthetase/4-amino-4-deoxychorismate lyase